MQRLICTCDIRIDAYKEIGNLHEYAIIYYIMYYNGTRNFRLIPIPCKYSISRLYNNNRSERWHCIETTDDIIIRFTHGAVVLLIQVVFTLFSLGAQTYLSGVRAHIARLHKQILRNCRISGPCPLPRRTLRIGCVNMYTI